MSRQFNLNSHRSSQEVPDSLPFRRFTDSHVKTSKPADVINMLQKSTYFQGLLTKKHKPSEIINLNRHESATGLSRVKALDLKFFSRKNAIVADKQETPQSPRIATSAKHIDHISPAHSHSTMKKISIASASLSNKEEVLKQRALVLEKKLRNFEKTSLTFRTDVSGDKLSRKLSNKNIALLSLNSPMMAAVDSHSLRSKGSKPAKTFKQKGLLSESKYELSQHKSLDRGSLIEASLAKLRDRITAALSKDRLLMKTLEKTIK